MLGGMVSRKGAQTLFETNLGLIDWFLEAEVELCCPLHSGLATHYSLAQPERLDGMGLGGPGGVGAISRFIDT